MALVDCVHALSNDDICILPTETVYGLACSAFSAEAIRKVYRLKGRPSTNPLIVHVLNHSFAEEISFTNEYSRKLAKAFWPGPLTFILPKKKSIPDEITAGLNSVAVRSPSHPLFRKILEQVQLPLAAPSANPSNKLSPTKFENAIAAFGKNCPPFLDGGQCDIGIESTVLNLTSTSPSISRLGPISKDAIEKVLGIQVGCEKTILKQTGEIKAKQSPGQGQRHYSPNTPLFLYSTMEQMLHSNAINESDILIMPRAKPSLLSPAKKIHLLYLSSTGEPKEITKNLFKILNDADKLKKKRIHASLFPSDDGLLSAVNDRLSRAATERF